MQPVALLHKPNTYLWHPLCKRKGQKEDDRNRDGRMCTITLQPSREEEWNDLRQISHSICTLCPPSLPLDFSRQYRLSASSFVWSLFPSHPSQHPSLPCLTAFLSIEMQYPVHLMVDLSSSTNADIFFLNEWPAFHQRKSAVGTLTSDWGKEED